MDGSVETGSLEKALGSERMLAPEAVTTMLRLRELGWGIKRIAREVGCAKATVRRWVNAGGFVAYRRAQRPGVLAPLESWMAERFRAHRGNADVVRQELASEHGIRVSLRTVERAVKPLRQALVAEARATVRFETPPGQQMQIDFGERRVWVANEPVRVHFFVATLGYSRRIFVQPFLYERQSDWLAGIEAAFVRFGGVAQELLVDNARALVDRHDVVNRQVRFNDRFLAFARHWSIRVRACAPYRARTKGKDESGVGYVKKNAIAGRRFESIAHLESHLANWMREIADCRIHGSTGDRPIDRFVAEAAALRPVAGRSPFQRLREFNRRVQSDACIEVDTNAYSVPWRLIGETVRVTVDAESVQVCHGIETIARHRRAHGQRQRCIDRSHLSGIVGAHVLGAKVDESDRPAAGTTVASPIRALLRPLSEYALTDESLR